jgi:Fe2+ transport system protein B
MLELPAYHWPHLRNLLIGLWERALIFLRRVGGIILALTMLLWFLSSFPAAAAGRHGRRSSTASPAARPHAMTVVFAPIGFNWQICIALVPGLAAREVAVSALATVYALSAADDDAGRDGERADRDALAVPGGHPQAAHRHGVAVAARRHACLDERTWSAHRAEAAWWGERLRRLRQLRLAAAAGVRRANANGS